MKDSRHETPQKANRHPKSITDHAKKNQKIVKKNLNSELLGVLEDTSVFESPKDVNEIDFSSISEISEQNLNGEDLTTSSSVETSYGSEATDSYIQSPLYSTITFVDDEKIVAPTNQSIVAKSEDVNLSCLEVELGLVIKHLKVAQLQLFNPRTMDLQYKRLLDALINVIVKEFYEMPQKEGRNEIITRKAHLAFIGTLLLVLSASVVIICFSGSSHTFNGPPPT